jgi:predicted nucleotidyltransferase
MKEYLENLINEKCPNAKPLFLMIRGSQAYGTALPTSDTDYSGVYIQSTDDILGNQYKEQINDDKGDIVMYELRRFLELVASNNPNILEMLYAPQDCIIYKHDAFNIILKQKDKFISKTCAKSFGGYAIAQIKKAKGLNKKQNWEEQKVTRKDVLDFVYVIDGEKSIPWKTWNESKQYDEKFIGVVSVPNSKDVYSLFYDQSAADCFSENVPKDIREINKQSREESGGAMGLGYKGLVKTGEGQNLSESNSLRYSSIPKGEKAICNIFYNKEGYTEHCKDFKSYQDWLKNRNEQRYVDVKNHDQKIDGKNLMHCVRLLQMAKEIGQGMGVIVKRPNADYLIQIRKGWFDLQTIINNSEIELEEIDNIFKNSNLPNSIDPKFIHQVILDVRKRFQISTLT